MANIINLPNGSQWDNDLSFADNSPESQAWLFETLKLALEQDVSVLRLGIEWIGGIGKNPYYNKLERDNLIVSCTNWYKYQGINLKVWSDLNNWELSTNTKFNIELKQF